MISVPAGSNSGTKFRFKIQGKIRQNNSGSKFRSKSDLFQVKAAYLSFMLCCYIETFFGQNQKIYVESIINFKYIEKMRFKITARNSGSKFSKTIQVQNSSLNLIYFRLKRPTCPSCYTATSRRMRRSKTPTMLSTWNEF